MGLTPEDKQRFRELMEASRQRFQAGIRGYIAATEGRPQADCPHAAGDLRKAWLEGWKDGKKATEEWS